MCAGTGVQKSIYLLEEVFTDYMGRGHIAKTNSAFMGERVVLVGSEVWKINMVGTLQCNHTAADKEAKAQRTKMKVGTYECCFFQRKTLPLVVVLWVNNNIVTTLSTYLS